MSRFCPNLKNKKVKQEFEELVEAFGGNENIAYYLWDANEGYSLDKAPNGAKSKHFETMLVQNDGDRLATLKQLGQLLYYDKLLNVNHMALYDSVEFLHTDEDATRWAENIARGYHTLRRKKIEVAKMIRIHNKYHVNQVRVEWDDKLAIPKATVYVKKKPTKKAVKAARSKPSYNPPNVPYYNIDLFSPEARELYTENELTIERIDAILSRLIPTSRINSNNKTANSSYTAVEYALNQIGKILGADMQDLYNSSTLSEFYDKLDFYLYNEYFQHVLPEMINETSNRLERIQEPIVEKTFIDNIKNALHGDKISGVYSQDVKMFGERTARILSQAFPNLYVSPNKRQYLGYIKRNLFSQTNDDKLYRKLQDTIKNENVQYFSTRNMLNKYIELAELYEHVPGLPALIRDKVYSDMRLYWKHRTVRTGGKNSIKKEFDIFYQIKEVDLDTADLFEHYSIFPDTKDKYSVKQTLRKIGSMYPQYSDLCAKISNAMNGDTYIYMRKDPERIKAGSTFRLSEEGKQILNDHTKNKSFITLSIDSPLYQEDPVATVIHEILHVIVHDYLEENPDLKKSIRDYIGYLLNTAPDNSKYGFKDEHEFISEFFSNAEFREILKATPAMEKSRFRSMFEQVLNKILSVLGIIRHENAFEQILPVMNNILDQSLAFSKQNPIQEADVDLLVGKNNLYTSVRDRKMTVEEVQSQITKEFENLYKLYQRKSNPTKSQTKNKDKLYEQNQKLHTLSKKRDGKLMIQALDYILDNIGVIETIYDSRQGGVLVMDPKELDEKARKYVFHFLIKHKASGWKDITPQHIVDMYDTVIVGYNEITKLLYNGEDFEREYNMYLSDAEMDAYKDKLKSVIDTMREVIEMWKQAAYAIGDRIVDDVVDNYVMYETEENLNAHKTIVKNWLHENTYFSDISFLRYFTNAQYSRNPVIRQMFQLIEEANTEKNENYFKEIEPIAELYDKLDSVWQVAKHGNVWTRMFAEFDNDGNPTGYFVRPVNYGQYEQDRDKFIEELNKEFLDKYGFFYVEDDFGNLVRSNDSSSFAEDEIWENGKMPIIFEYELELEKWISEHANRKYNFTYYSEMMSHPFIFEKSNGLDHHGLSPKTYFSYKRLNKQITYYLNKCTDFKTGLTKIELLSKDELSTLDALYKQLEEMSQPYTEEGDLKDSEQVQQAIELQMWQAYCGKRQRSIVDFSAYYEELNRLDNAVAEAMAEGNQEDIDNAVRIRNNFEKYNAQFGINPHFLYFVFGQADQYESSARTVLVRQKNARRNLVRSKDGSFISDLSKYQENVNFFLECAKIDQELEGCKSDMTQDEVKRIDKHIKTAYIPYVENGKVFRMENGQLIREDYNIKHAGEYIKFYDHYVYYLTNYYNQYNKLPGEQDPQSSIMNSQALSNMSNVRDKIEYLLSYKKTHQKKDEDTGEYITVSEIVPSSIFTIMLPKKDSFHNPETGLDEPTITLIPRRRFQIKQNDGEPLLNENFDNSNPNPIQPKYKYYDNHKNYYRIQGEYKQLYDMLTQAVADAINATSNQQTAYDYRLPQLEAQVATVLTSRLRGGLLKAFKFAGASMWNIREGDEDFRKADEYGNMRNIRRRFVNKLDADSRQFISLDVVGGTLAMILMKHNYISKSNVEAKLRTLLLNMGTDVRDIRSGETNRGENSYKTAEYLLDTHLYEISSAFGYGVDNERELNRLKIFASRLVKKSMSLLALWLLAGNVLSFIGGGTSSAIAQITQAMAGKHFGIRTLLESTISTFIKIPKLLANLNNKIANCKEVAMMQLNGLSPDYENEIKNIQHNHFAKNISIFGMGGFTLVDYWNNLVLTKAMYKSVKYYDGDELPKGFYSEYGFIKMSREKLGKSKLSAKYEFAKLHTTLWDMYEYKNHTAQLKNVPEAQYVTKALKTQMSTKIKNRSALYNGMAPVNDKAQYKSNIAGSYLASMRAWFMQNIQESFGGGINDFVVPEYKEESKYPVVGGRTKKQTQKKQRDYTESEKQNMRGYSYALGTTDDAILIQFGRSIKSICRWILRNIFFMKSKYGDKVKLSEDQKYAWKYMMSWLFALTVVFSGAVYSLKQARNIAYNREPVVKYNSNRGYSLNVNFQNMYNNRYDMTANILLRGAASQSSMFDPFSIQEFLSRTSVLTSGIEQQVSELERIIQDATGVKDVNWNSRVGGSGSYKNDLQITKTVFKCSGILDNWHTLYNQHHLRTTNKFYLDMFGGYLDYVVDKKEITPNLGGGRRSSSNPWSVYKDAYKDYGKEYKDQADAYRSAYGF